jgi:hypothetical protein
MVIEESAVTEELTVTDAPFNTRAETD